MNRRVISKRLYLTHLDSMHVVQKMMCFRWDYRMQMAAEDSLLLIVLR